LARASRVYSVYGDIEKRSVDNVEGASILLEDGDVSLPDFRSAPIPTLAA
jgi:hypothetical protein